MIKLNDKNGVVLKTGQIVKIEGGYFKSDNGYFIIKHSPKDEGWNGSDYCLRKCSKKGIESKSKYSTAFYPLMVTVSSREKRFEAREHNNKYATIEVVGEIHTQKIEVTWNMWGREEKKVMILDDKDLEQYKNDRFTEVRVIEGY
jgi:hypothetical protein